jgi:uncharacterized protein YegP (UPF0339 family)
MSGKFEIKKAKDDEFYFHLKASNGQIILASQRYVTKSSAENGIESVKKKRLRRRTLRAQGRQKRRVHVQPKSRQPPGHRYQPGLHNP